MTEQLVAGEVLVDASNAFAIGDEHAALAIAILDSPASDWEAFEADGGGFTIERRPVVGNYQPAGVLLTRGSRAVKAAPDVVFKALTTPAGYGIIDPGSEPEEFAKYVERFEGWPSSSTSLAGGRLEVANAFMQAPGGGDQQGRGKEFVVLNSHNPRTRLFCSTSCLHASRPGGSVYQKLVPPDAGDADRLVNVFAVRVAAVPGKPEESLTQWLNYILVGAGNPDVENAINAGFWAGLFTRLDAFDFAAAAAMSKL